jgi:sulfate permease, SulP family
MSHEVMEQREKLRANRLIRSFLPIAGQLAGYRSSWLPTDILAGLSVAAVALPTAIAYPAIAGLPPQAGLYAAILPPIGYAVFGPSRQLMVGPDTATTMMLASALLSLGVSAPDERVAAAAAFALAVGLCCIVAGFVGLGIIANFLSRPVLMGFLSGVALDLLAGQIKRLTAVPIGSGGLLRPLIEFATKLDRLHLPTLLLGLGLFVALRLLHRYAPRLPGPLLAIAAGILLSFALDLPSRGVALVGAIPRALPSLALPLPGGIAIDQFALGTLGILLVSFGSGIVTARSFGAKNHYSVDANRELVGFGAANIASGLFGGFPVTSSDSRTAVNDAVGGHSQLVGLVAAGGLLGAVLFLGDLLAYLPEAALGAVIASAALDLIDPQGFRSLEWTPKVRHGK